MKIIVAGGRDFIPTPEDINWLTQTILADTDIEIVSGGAKGADTFGEQYAKDNEYNLTIFKADWAQYNRGAGAVRNQQMADYADKLIAFWDGRSAGTADMVKRARNKGLRVFIRSY